MSTPSTERDRISSPHSVQPDKTLAVDHGASVPADVNSQLAELTARHCKDTDFVTSLARGIAVMQALADKRRRMSMAQISHITGIPRAAVRRNLLTLSKIGFVAEDEGRRFYLRPKILSLSHAYLSATPLAVFAQPILDRLGEELQVACSTAVFDGDEIVYLARSSSSRLISPNVNVGRRIPAYCTSIGRALLSSLASDELDAYFSRARFYSYTNQTVTAPDELRKIVRSARSTIWMKRFRKPTACLTDWLAMRLPGRLAAPICWHSGSNWGCSGLISRRRHGPKCRLADLRIPATDLRVGQKRWMLTSTLARFP